MIYALKHVQGRGLKTLDLHRTSNYSKNVKLMSTCLYRIYIELSNRQLCKFMRDYEIEKELEEGTKFTDSLIKKFARKLRLLKLLC